MPSWVQRIMFIAVFTIVLVLVGCNTEDKKESKEASGEVKAAEADGIDRSDWPKKVSLAVTGIEGMEELLRRYEPFQKKMEELLDVEMELFAVSDRVVSATAMEYDQVDIVLAGPSEYAQIKSANPTAEPLAAVERDEYYTVIIVPEDSDMKKIEDVKGKKIAMKDVGSTSGHIGPSAVLLENGIDLDRDVEVLLLGDARIEAFKSGEVDILATGIRDYNKMVEEDGAGKYRILHEGPPLPSDPFIASGKLPESFRAELKRVLLENQEEILESMLLVEENDKYEKARMIEVTDADFDQMRETYKVLGIEL